MIVAYSLKDKKLSDEHCQKINEEILNNVNFNY